MSDRPPASGPTPTPQWAIELDEAIERGSSRPPLPPSSSLGAATATVQVQEQQELMGSTEKSLPAVASQLKSKSARDAALCEQAAKYLASAFHPPQCRANRYVVSGGLTDGSMCDCGLTALRTIVIGKATP